jgi:hypothetical protein
MSWHAQLVCTASAVESAICRAASTAATAVHAKRLQLAVMLHWAMCSGGLMQALERDGRGVLGPGLGMGLVVLQPTCGERV